MEKTDDGQDRSQWELDSPSEEELWSLLLDPETEDFHSWLFDILMNFEFEEYEIQGNSCEDLTDSELDDDETQGDPREELLEKLVNRCHDAKGMSTEARDFRKKVLKVVLQEAVYKPQAALSGQDADIETPMPISEVLQEFMDELSKRRGKERMKRIKEIAEKQKIKEQARRWKYRWDDNAAAEVIKEPSDVLKNKELEKWRRERAKLRNLPFRSSSCINWSNVRNVD